MRSLFAIISVVRKVKRNSVFWQGNCAIFNQLLCVCMCEQWRNKGAYSLLQWRPEGSAYTLTQRWHK